MFYFLNIIYYFYPIENKQVLNKTPYLTLYFKQNLAPYELPLLRSAILKAVQKQHVLYHNHKGGMFRQDYPLIQYKSIKGKAAVIYLSDGVEAIPLLFNATDKIIYLSNHNKDINLSVEQIVSKNYTLMPAQEALFFYKIRNWLPLHNEHYTKYHQIEEKHNKISFLKQHLVKNIITFMKGVSAYPCNHITIGTFEIKQEKWISFKDIKFKGFDVFFSTNAFLPPYIGLGKGAAHNYGVIIPVKKQIQEQVKLQLNDEE